MPRIAAKPIIDVVVPGLEVMPTAIAALVAAGYQPECDLGIPGARGLRGNLTNYLRYGAQLLSFGGAPLDASSS